MKQQLEQRLQRLRTTYNSGLTRPVAWRKQQLQQLQQMLDDHESKLLQALQQDLGKSSAEGWLTELGFLKSDIKHTLHHLNKWMKPQRVRQPMLAVAREELSASRTFGSGTDYWGLELSVTIITKPSCSSACRRELCNCETIRVIAENGRTY